MKIVYCAGPYSAPNHAEKTMNIMRAWQAGFNLAEAHVGFIAPHCNAQWMDAANKPAWWYAMDIELLVRAADAILMLDGWEQSPGALRELAQANDLKLPVFYSVEEVREWAK